MFHRGTDFVIARSREPKCLRNLPVRVDAGYCSVKSQPHGGTGKVNWRTHKTL